MDVAADQTSALPIAQLESLRSRAAQIIESIQALQRLLLEADSRPAANTRINNVISGGATNIPDSQQQPGVMALAMPTWPDILAKYNLLLSQTQTLSNALVGGGASHHTSSTRSSSNNANNNAGVYANVDQKMNANMFARIALHPAAPMTDLQLDNGLAPLLRNQQTIDVLKFENETVKSLSAHLKSVQGPKGGSDTRGNTMVTGSTPNYSAILQECEEIRQAHDSRCERAVRAVALLREKYDWRARVAVETAEPEEFVPLSPTLNIPRNFPPMELGNGDNGGGDTPMTGSGSGSGDGDEEDEEELEDVLGPSIPTPGSGTPAQTPMEIS